LAPQSSAVPGRVGQGDEEIGQRRALAVEQLGDAGNEVARVVHDGECRTHFRASAKASKYR